MKERILRLCARGKIAINLRNLELLQTQVSEDEESAWRRLRSKLPYSGRQLDEIFLMEPTAMPTTGGSTPSMPQPSTDSNGEFDNDIFGNNSTMRPNLSSSEGSTSYSSKSPNDDDIFGGSTNNTVRPRTPLSNPPTSPLNLIGKLEGWGIGPATSVMEVSIKVSAGQSKQITGAQLKELIKKLPDGMTFELSLEKEDD